MKSAESVLVVAMVCEPVAWFESSEATAVVVAEE